MKTPPSVKSESRRVKTRSPGTEIAEITLTEPMSNSLKEKSVFSRSVERSVAKKGAINLKPLKSLTSSELKNLLDKYRGKLNSKETSPDSKQEKIKVINELASHEEATQRNLPDLTT